MKVEVLAEKLKNILNVNIETNKFAVSNAQDKVYVLNIDKIKPDYNTTYYNYDLFFISQNMGELQDKVKNTLGLLTTNKPSFIEQNNLKDFNVLDVDFNYEGKFIAVFKLEIQILNNNYEFI